MAVNYVSKLITCRKCKKEFEPLYQNGIIMSRYCISCLVKKKKEKDKKDWDIEKKAIKEKLKTHSEWLNDFQRIFNQYIRTRDKGKTCISCGNPLSGKYDSGHFFSVGAYPNLRFNEDNAHGQCVACNQHKHGNITEYSLNLPLRIGNDRFIILLESRNQPLKLTTEEIKEKINYYKQKIKSLQS